MMSCATLSQVCFVAYKHQNTGDPETETKTNNPGPTIRRKRNGTFRKKTMMEEK